MTSACEGMALLRKDIKATKMNLNSALRQLSKDIAAELDVEASEERYERKAMFFSNSELERILF